MFGGVGLGLVHTAQEDDDPVKWRDKRNAMQCLQFLCLSERMADVWFTFGKTGARLPAHKFVLRMRSEVFDAMFDEQSADAAQEVEIEDIRTDTMEHVLRFLYTDCIEINKDNVFTFLHVAKKYVLEGLRDRCIQALIKSIEATDVCGVYENVQGLDVAGRVTSACLEYIWRHAWKVFETESFLKISKNTLTTILESDNLTGDEISTFRAVMKWAEYQATSNNVQPTPENLQECIGGALHAVRFPLMSIEELKEEVEPAGVLTDNDLFALRRCVQEKDKGLNVEVEKFNCYPRSGGIMTEKILNSYPVPERVPGGCDQIYYISFYTSDDIRLHSIKGPLVKYIIDVKMSVHNINPAVTYSRPSKESLENDFTWTRMHYSVAQNEGIVFMNDPILMPTAVTFVRLELDRRPGTDEPNDVQKVAAARGRGRKRGRHQNLEQNLVINRISCMSLIIKKTTLYLSSIPPGISEMSFR